MGTRPSLVAIPAAPGGRFARLVEEVWAAGDAVFPLPEGAPPPVLDAAMGAARPGSLHRDGERVRLEGPPVTEGTAAVLLTSGSTGAPKAVELSHGALRASAAAAHTYLSAGPGDRWLACLPLHHIAGFSILVRSALLGGEAELHDRFDVSRVAASDATLVSFVPTQLAGLLDAGVDLARFKAILLGGASIPPELVRRAEAAGARIVRSYGMTETCGGCVYDGRPLEGVAVRLDDNGRISISSPTLMTGYRGQPELTVKVLSNGWFESSDVGRWDGDRLAVLGRADGIITTGGEKVAPAAVEAALLEHPWVADAAVVGVPDDRWGEAVVALVVGRDSGEAVSSEELRAFLRPRLAAHEVPKRIVASRTIPRLPSGKPDTAAVREALLTS